MRHRPPRAEARPPLLSARRTRLPQPRLGQAHRHGAGDRHLHSFLIGALAFDRQSLEKRRDSGKSLAVRVVGLLSIAEDVPHELARTVFESLKVQGIFRAGKAVKEALANRMG
jgi:hypothetical protein